MIEETKFETRPRSVCGSQLTKIQWLSANMVVSSFAIGALAQPIFELGFIDTALTIVLINALAITPVCFFSTFGPRFGLRQMVLSRFFFGYHFVKISAYYHLLFYFCGLRATRLLTYLQSLSSTSLLV